MRFMKVWGALLLFTFVALVVLSGCALARTVATNGLIASDEAADLFADEWLEGATHRVEHCRKRALKPDTPEDRRACMGVFGEGDKAEVALKALIAVQQSVVVAVRCSQKSIQMPADFASKCFGQDKPDWIKLAADLKSAWNALLPYIEAARAEVKK